MSHTEPSNTGSTTLNYLNKTLAQISLFKSHLNIKKKLILIFQSQ